MRNIILVIFLGLFLLPDTLFAQRVKKHQMGASWSSNSGAGLSYQVALDRNHALQFNGFAYYFGDEAPDDLTIYANLGIEYKYTFSSKGNLNTFWYIGVGNWYIEEREIVREIIDDIPIRRRVTEFSSALNFSIGGGYEYFYRPNISIGASAGPQLQIAESTVFFPLSTKISDKMFVGLGGSVWIRFAFN